MAITILIGEVAEGSTAYLTISFFDKAGDPATPSTINYRIDDVASGAAIRAETPIVAPASVVEIELSADDNRILSQANATETREITVSWTFGGGKPVNDSGKWSVRNLQFKA